MNAKVLLVDDSGLARRSTRRVLEEAGTPWSKQTTGCRRWNIFAVEKPDIVMLDLVMKGMYGLEVLAKLRELDPDVRVIVVSADIQTSSREMVKAAGASAFINKPAQPAHVVAVLQEVLRGPTPWS